MKMGDTVLVLKCSKPKFVGRRGIIVCFGPDRVWVRVKFPYQFSKKTGPMINFAPDSVRVITALDELAAIE